MMMQPARTQPSLPMDSPPSPRRSWMTMPMPTMITPSTPRTRPMPEAQFRTVSRPLACSGNGGRRVRDNASVECGEGVHGETFHLVELVSATSAAMSVVKRWYSRAVGTLGVSSCRQASTQGRVQRRGAPAADNGGEVTKGFGCLSGGVREDGKAEEVNGRGCACGPLGEGAAGRGQSAHIGAADQQQLRGAAVLRDGPAVPCGPCPGQEIRDAAFT